MQSGQTGLGCCWSLGHPAVRLVSVAPGGVGDPRSAAEDDTY